MASSAGRPRLFLARFPHKPSRAGASGLGLAQCGALKLPRGTHRRGLPRHNHKEQTRRLRSARRIGETPPAHKSTRRSRAAQPARAWPAEDRSSPPARRFFFFTGRHTPIPPQPLLPFSPPSPGALAHLPFFDQPCCGRAHLQIANCLWPRARGLCAAARARTERRSTRGERGSQAGA